MKIGLLTAHASRRAAGVWAGVARLGKALADSGLDVEIFGIADHCGDTAGVGWDGPPLRLYDVVGSEAFGYAPRLVRSLQDRRPSLLHANGLWMYPSLASLRANRRAKRPYLVAPHGMLDPWAVANAAWKKRLVGWWFENAHLAGAACLHALTEAEARAIRAYGLPNPICVIPHGIDLPQRTGPVPSGWARDVEKDRKTLLFLGRLHPKKGLENLLAAWQDVQPSAAARDWMLVIAGWGEGGYTRQLERMGEGQVHGGTLRFVGPQFGDDKAASFARADAFILPSLSEGLPVAVLESWSYGVPVLMTEACNLPEGFAAGAALRIGTDPAAIAAGLRRLFALSDAERADMGARGEALVRERFTWRTVGEQMAAVYRWVLGGGPPPPCVLTN